MHTLSTRELWLALAGRTLFAIALTLAGIALLIYFVYPYDAGIARGMLSGAVLGTMMSLFYTLKQNAFLVTNLEVDNKENMLTLYGKYFEGTTFSNHQRTISLDTIHKVEFTPRKFGESADSLRFIDKRGESETLKAVPGYLSPATLQALHSQIPSAMLVMA